jgi:UDP-N-acetylglucosamine transferase subunit ALG13
MAFHLLDPAELEFPFEGAATFQDLEQGERLPVVPEDQRSRYQDLMKEHLAALTARMAATGVDYSVCDVSRPLDFVLYEYLARRQFLRSPR